MSEGTGRVQGEVLSSRKLVPWMKRHIPDTHMKLLSRLNDAIGLGSFISVHAGIMPDDPGKSDPFRCLLD